MTMGIRKFETGHRPFTMLLGIVFVLAIKGSGTSGLHAAECTCRSLYNVGYQALDLKYGNDGDEQAITVAVWYPTSAKPKPHIYGGPTSGNIAVDAALFVKGGPYPLLIFSHGYGGGGLGYVFFTEQLAAKGWIVVAPDHHDRHSAVRIKIGRKKDFDRLEFLQYVRKIASSSPRDRGKYLYRLDEMKLTLDRMLSHPSFGNLIDRERIAVGGHSFGGFTSLGLCGTIKERHDTRVKAVLLFSTGAGGYLFTEEELRSVRIPSMLFIGEREREQQRGTKTMSELSDKIYRSVFPPKYFLEVKGANHFSFNNRFVENRRSRLLSGTEGQFKVIRRYSIVFLDKHVTGRKDADRVLERSDPMLTRYTREPSPNISGRDLKATGKTTQRTISGKESSSTNRDLGMYGIHKQVDQTLNSEYLDHLS